MQSKDINKLLIRCSSIGKLDVKPQKATELVAETTKKYLAKVFAEWYYSRSEDLNNKYLAKGHAREKNSLQLISRNQKIVLVKNDIRLNNDFVTGELDAFECSPSIPYNEWTIDKAIHTHDAKSSWSLFTFLEASQQKQADKDYVWQGHGYMWLSGAQKHTIHHCLVNGTVKTIDKEKYYAAMEMGIIDTSMEDPTYIEKCKQIERNHIFDLGEFINESPWYELANNTSEWSYDIPYYKRIHSRTIERDEQAIEKIKTFVLSARSYIADTFLNER